MNPERALKHTDQAYLHSDITDISSGSFYRVYNGLGFGFLESVYRNALATELTKAGVSFEREVPIVDPAGPWLPKVPAESGTAPGDVDVV